MEYDKSVLTITDILMALNKFENKQEIVDSIQHSLYDIETDWHSEELYRRETARLQGKIAKIKDYLLENKADAQDILDIINK